VGEATDEETLRRIIKRRGREFVASVLNDRPPVKRKRGGSFKWYHRDHSPNSRLMTLWVNARVAAYKRHGSRLAQHKIQPTLREIFKDRRGQSQFSDAIEPTFDTKEKPLLEIATKDTQVKRVLDHHSKANRWMKRWKDEGDPQYGYWMGCLALAKQCIDEGWRVEVTDRGLRITTNSPPDNPVARAGEDL
jgi:hypothetical protein